MQEEHAEKYKKLLYCESIESVTLAAIFLQQPGAQPHLPGIFKSNPGNQLLPEH